MPNGGGFRQGGGGGFDASALEAFRTCMKDNGAELPANGTGMRDLKTDDPAIANALKKCRPLLPSMPPRQPGAGTDAPSAAPASGA
ncbi:hypothetical protein DQ384_35655 [Sphaerisporangium album]|uniref:Uncharacterized protein n=2 Tax=Sphaerisporangium album TaxID=509200 RepID=A0A367EYI1_9ACTN|nr:hypothetical protein DQ384_35655 [Sphaerisporangium album]